MMEDNFIASYILCIITVYFYIDLYNILLFDWLDVIFQFIASVSYSLDSVQV